MSKGNVISFALARARRQAESEFDWRNIEALIERADRGETLLPDLDYFGLLLDAIGRPGVPESLRERAEKLIALNGLIPNVEGPPLGELATSIQKELTSLLRFVEQRGIGAEAGGTDGT